MANEKEKCQETAFKKKKKIKGINILFEYRELQHNLGKYNLHKLEDLWLRMLENGDSCFYQTPK